MDRSVYVNQVFRDMRSDRLFRLLWMEPSADGTFIYWLDGKASVPNGMPLTELEEGIEKGWITEEEDPFSVPADVSEDDRKYRDAIWERMKDALLDEPGIYKRRPAQAIWNKSSRIAEKRSRTCINVLEGTGKGERHRTHSCLLIRTVAERAKRGLGA